jgi:hypothetical protein
MNKPFERFTAVVCLAGAALVGYWAWRYEGLYRWLAELQLRWFESYEEQITFILALVIVVGPIIAIAAIVRKLGPGAVTTTVTTSNDAEGVPKQHPTATQIQLFLGRWGFALTIAIVGLFLAGPGTFFVYRGKTAGEVMRVSAADFDAGRVPSTSWVSITGEADVHEAVTISSSGSRATYYVPVVSENYDPKRGVTLFLKADADKINDDVRKIGGRFDGMLEHDALPGMVREEFKRRQTMPAADYRILDLGRTPADDVRVGRDMLIFGGGLLVVAAVMAAWPWWKARRVVKPVAVAAPSTAPDPRFQVKAILPLGATPSLPPTSSPSADDSSS